MTAIGKTKTGVTPASTNGGGAHPTGAAQGTASTQVQSPPPSAPAQPEALPPGSAYVSGGTAAPVTRTPSGMPPGFKMNTGSFSAATSVSGMTGDYIARPTERSSFFGYTDVTAVRPTGDGFEVDLTLRCKQENEKVYLMLQVPLLDKKSGAMTYYTIDVPTYDPKSGAFSEMLGEHKVEDPITKSACFEGRRTYRYSLAQLNELLKKHGLPVAIEPGDQLAIGGITEGSGHRIANGAVNVIRVPKPQAGAAANATNVRVGNMTNQTMLNAADMPLDVSVKLPADVLNKVVNTSKGRTKIGDIIEGEITTRLETEYKGAVDAKQMNEMITNAYHLSELTVKAQGGDASARQALDKLLGPSLEMVPVKRHWLDNNGVALGNGGDENNVQRDANGWPALDPMADTYSDDKGMTFSKGSGAVRVRGNAQKQGHAEFKLDGGVLDPKTGIRQRVELGLSLKPGATEQDLAVVLQEFNKPGDRVYWGPAGHLLREAKEIGVDQALFQGRTPWADVTQIRHKFSIREVKTGVEGEISLDMVHAKTLRPEHNGPDGKPQEATFYVVETELDHLQISSSNTEEAPNVSGRTAFPTDVDQAKFLESAKASVASGTVDFDILREPQLHSHQHVKGGGFRATSSYQVFEAMNERLLRALSGGNPPGPARQKAAHFAELIGLIPPEQTQTV